MKKTLTKLLSLTLALLLLIPAIAACNKDNPDTENSGSGTTEDSTKLSVALDLTGEWEKINGENTLVQGCLVINKAFAEAHPAEVKKFLEDYNASVDFIKAGSDDAINMIVNAGILPKAAIAKKALPNCNICYIAGTDMKAPMNTFCEKIFAADATSIGGKMPTDDFYYVNSAGADATPDNELEVKIYALNGTTALGMAQMIDNTKNGKSEMNYDISLHTSADAITGAIISGECAIAALPTNVAVKLFNKSQGKLQLLALNTLGVLYLMQNGESITSLADLEGKTVYLPGAGSNPEYIFSALAKSAGVNVTIDTTTYNSPDALQTALAAGKAALGVLPEPKVTAALAAANSTN